ncbi:MOSC domain-containing protein [Lacrimispora xylanolytica]|uniref:Molybdopterin-binding protein n=1 Tax=Lacrimispora xylanolytica TaxID=29375 RepID=A0ABY7AGC0_9FIRM|nr:MOSC domain-containing protein [Lacrimispora xylanolytica]WAJ25283.1 molybdopterin-binding protein [Lacrimispora xylanolytica]
MGIVKAVCISENRGTQKVNVKTAEFAMNYGIVGDAHGGDWHRQVSLLSNEKIEAFQREGADVLPGAFGENLIVEGFDFSSIPIGTRFQCKDVILQLTQHGKQCHSHCQIYYKMGKCIMPTEGTFAEVIKGGIISVGDELIQLKDRDDRLTAAVITLSDSGFAGQREDRSGLLLKELLEEKGYRMVESLLLPDEQSQIEEELIRLSDQRDVNLIVTTGGTGFSPRDCTPEATLAVATRNAPGISEAIRLYSMAITKRAMLSRGVSVIRGKTLIVNLPGSPKAVKESMDCIVDQLPHGLNVLLGRVSNCARP